MSRGQRFPSLRARLAYYRRQARRRGFLLRYSVLYLTAYLVLVLFVPAAAKPLNLLGIQTTSPTHTITGTVMNGSKGAPMPGVVVDAGGFRSTTRADGSYELRFMAEEESRIPIVFTWAGKTMVKKIDIHEGRAVVVDAEIP